MFNYAHVPWLKKHQRIIDEKTLPGPLEKLKILKNTIETLTSSGYVYIGMDHFARPEDSLTRAFYEKTLYRNFQGYSTRWGCDLLALGMSSISQLKNSYAQNFKYLPEYYEALNQGRLATQRGIRLNRDDQLRRYVIMRLMCDFELNKKRVEEKFQINFDSYFEDALTGLERFVKDGLVQYSDHTIKVTEMGRLLIRNIAMVFDRYLKQDQEQNKPLYSRTI